MEDSMELLLQANDVAKGNNLCHTTSSHQNGLASTAYQMKLLLNTGAHSAAATPRPQAYRKLLLNDVHIEAPERHDAHAPKHPQQECHLH